MELTLKKAAGRFREFPDILFCPLFVYGNSDTAFWILYVLHGSEEQMTQTDICNSLYQPRQSTNTALKKLEEDGIIKKTPVPGNQKSKYIVLTQKGRTFVERIVVPMKQVEQDTLALFSDEEIKIHLSILKKRCELFRTLISKEGVN